MKLFDLIEYKSPSEIEEEIKGWKNAVGDIAKARSRQADASKGVKLVRLKNDGTESKMHDSTSSFNSEEEAKEHHDNLVRLNPTRVIRHHMHSDGKIMKLDGKSNNIEEVYPGQSSGRLKNYVHRKYGGDITCGKASKVKSSDASKALKNRASWYQSLHCK